MAGVSIQGIAETKLRLERTGKKTTREALRASRRGAMNIRDRARAYAPIDKGNLEESIEVKESKDGFHRIIWDIGVNVRKLGIGWQRYRHRYDIYQHEGVDPKTGRDYGLGPRSQRKAAETGMDVGSQFLTRAVWDFEKKIRAAVRRAAKAGARK